MHTEAAPSLLVQPVHDRTLYVGGSDVPALLGISPWKNKVDLWFEKTSMSPAPDVSNPKAKARGSRLEPYVRDMIAEEFGLEILRYNTRYIDPDVPYFAAEIDFETADANGEIKTSMFGGKQWGAEGTDELPLHYIAQVQWGMGVNGARKCLVYALIGDDLKPYTVHRDDELIYAMRGLAHEFWNEYVLKGQRPPIEHSHDTTIQTLRRLYPGTNGETIEASQSQCAWRTVIEEAQGALLAYEKVVNTAKAHLMEEMGEASILAFPDGKGYVRKKIQRKGYSVEATEYMEFKLYKMKGGDA